MNQESATGATDKDEQEIRALMARLADSWARGDAQTYGAEFTDDCDYVAFDGTRFRGPAEPATHLARLFDTVRWGCPDLTDRADGSVRLPA